METLSRFIRSRNHFSPNTARVKQAAFQPIFNISKSRFETSVFVVDELEQNDIWALGAKHIDIALIKARADIRHEQVVAQSVEVDYNNCPERHADIVGWPSNKDERKMVAMQLASAASLKLAPA